jgi:hypothetical protein
VLPCLGLTLSASCPALVSLTLSACPACRGKVSVSVSVPAEERSQCCYPALVSRSVLATLPWSHALVSRSVPALPWSHAQSQCLGLTLSATPLVSRSVPAEKRSHAQCYPLGLTLSACPALVSRSVSVLPAEERSRLSAALPAEERSRLSATCRGKVPSQCCPTCRGKVPSQCYLQRKGLEPPSQPYESCAWSPLSYLCSSPP